MFDLSWGEMMLVGAVALIVIGPKDLPRTLRAVGQMVGKVRRMASEFQGQFNQAMREAELDQVRKDVEGMSRAAQAGFNPAKAARDEIKRAIDGKPGEGAKASTPAASGPSLQKGPSLDKAATGPSPEKASPAASAGDNPGAVAAPPPASAATPAPAPAAATPAATPAPAPAPIPVDPVPAGEREEVKP